MTIVARLLRREGGLQFSFNAYHYFQAACNPVAYSLMADFFPSKYRAVVFSVYHYGVYVGKFVITSNGDFSLVVVKV